MKNAVVLVLMLLFGSILYAQDFKIDSVFVYNKQSKQQFYLKKVENCELHINMQSKDVQLIVAYYNYKQKKKKEIEVLVSDTSTFAVTKYLEYTEMSSFELRNMDFDDKYLYSLVFYTDEENKEYIYIYHSDYIFRYHISDYYDRKLQRDIK